MNSLTKLLHFFKIKLEKYFSFHICFYMFISTMIIFGCKFWPLQIFTFLVIVLYMVLFDEDKRTYIMLFLSSFSFIYKVSFLPTSFFTILLFINCAIYIFNHWKNNLGFFLFLPVVILCSTLSFNVNLLDLIKFVLYLLSFYCFISSFTYKKSYRIILAFSFGLLWSTLFGAFKYDIPFISSFFESDPNYIYFGSVKFHRFSGLWTDPNYYTLEIVVCLSCLLPYLLKNKISKYYWIVMFLLFLSGIFSISKSYFLIISLLFVITFIYLVLYKKWIILFILLCFLLLIVFCASPFIDRVFQRFLTDDFTTGRKDIWLNYINHINGDIRAFFFGQGLDSSSLINRTDIHNYFLETLYHIGLFGFVSYFIYYFLGISCVYKKFKRPITFFTLCPLFIFIISSFFLSELFYLKVPLIMSLISIPFSENFSYKSIENMTSYECEV